MPPQIVAAVPAVVVAPDVKLVPFVLCHEKRHTVGFNNHEKVTKKKESNKTL